MRPLLILTAACLVAVLLVNVVWPAFWQAGWTPTGFYGRCWASACVISDGTYLEMSVGEYAQPVYTVPNGAPYIP